MIKRISHQNLLTTPFVATKDWSLANTINDDLVLLEQSGSGVDQIPVAMEYLDYYLNNPVLNRSCNIALEQQTEDQVFYREGQKLTGAFYPDGDPTNEDGTYKRLIYSQVKEAFYNTRRNPLEIFGMENIDFPLSKTERYLSDVFREFLIPQHFFGDKIKKGSVSVADNALDDNVDIEDDGFGNLVASPNLFSKIQEVRSLGNTILSGSANVICPPPIVSVPTMFLPLTGSLTASVSGGYSVPPYEVNLTWIDTTSEDGYYVWRATLDTGSVTWSSFINIATVAADVTTYQDTLANIIASASYQVNAFNYVGTSSFSNTASVQVSQSADAGTLTLIDGTIYAGGPYDTFQTYTADAAPANGGYGWSGGWEVRSPGAPDQMVMLSVDDLDSYSAISGSSMIGANSGSGWSAAWTGSM